MTGIDALFNFQDDSGSADTDFEIRKIEASKIIVQPQVRTAFDDESLGELAQSIREIGLQEPLTVKPDTRGEHFTLINGERRFRALKLIAGDQFPYTLIECKVQQKDVDDNNVELIQMADNMVRKNLSIREQAKSVKRLSDKGLTLEKIGAAIGKNKASVSKLLSLADMPQSFMPLFDLTDDYTLLYSFKVLSDKYPASASEIDQFAEQCIADGEITRAAVKALKNKLEGKTDDTQSTSEELGAQHSGEAEAMSQTGGISQAYGYGAEDSEENPEEAPEQFPSQYPAQSPAQNPSQFSTEDSVESDDWADGDSEYSESIAGAYDSGAEYESEGEKEKKKTYGVSKFLWFDKDADKLVCLLDDGRQVEVTASQIKVKL